MKFDLCAISSLPNQEKILFDQKNNILVVFLKIVFFLIYFETQFFKFETGYRSFDACFLETCIWCIDSFNRKQFKRSHQVLWVPQTTVFLISKIKISNFMTLPAHIDILFFGIYGFCLLGYVPGYKKNT